MTDTPFAPTRRILQGDLLDFTRSQIGHGLPLKKEQMDIQPVCERIVEQQHQHGHELVVVGSRPRRCWSWPLWRAPLAVTLTSELQADVLIVPKAKPRKPWTPPRVWGPAKERL